MSESKQPTRTKANDVILEKVEFAGAYGTVKQADDNKVCKVMNEHVKLASFIREVSVQLYLGRYMEVPSIYEIDIHEKLFIMEKMGKSFCMSMHKDKESTIKLLYSTALQFKYLHELGVIHGDISTANIVFKGSGGNKHSPRIIDFGGSQLMGCRSSKVSQSNIFSSPEILKSRILLGEKSKIVIDPESEIWSYGIIAYYLLGKDKTINDHEGIVTIQNYIKLFGSNLMFKSKKLESHKASLMHQLGDHPMLSKTDIDFIQHICKYNAKDRPNWDQIIKHPIFDSVRGNNATVAICDKIPLSNKYPNLTFSMFVQAKKKYNLDIKRILLCKSIINRLTPEIIVKNKASDIIYNIVDLVNIVTCSIPSSDVGDVTELLVDIMISSSDFFNPLNYIDKTHSREILLTYYFGEYSNINDIREQTIELYNSEEDWVTKNLKPTIDALIPN